MSSTATSPASIPAALGRRTEHIAIGRVWRTGVLAAVLTAAATMIIRTIGVTVGAVPADYQPLQIGPIIAVSVAAALVATGILAALGRWVRRPLVTFRIIAGIGLLFSFSGPLQAGAGKMQGGAASGATVITMLLMHIAAAGVIAGLLTTIGHAPRTGT